jgi:hypothetical protein
MEDQMIELAKKIQELNRNLLLKQREYQELASAKINSDLESAAAEK